METSNKIEIALSKSKLALMALGSAIFVGLGFLFVFRPPHMSNSFFGNPTTIFTVGIAAILFFGLIGFFLFKKLLDKSPGLIISDEGVFDNASAVSAGFIPWTDVIAIKETNVANQTFINLVVKNPQDYIDRHKSAFKRKVIQMNYNTYGTVIGIPSNGLKCNYQQLKMALEKAFSDFKRK